MNRDKIINDLAQVIVESNIECHNELWADDKEYSTQIKADFSNYGVDYDTVRIILDGLFTEVGERASKIQSDPNIIKRLK